MTANSKNTIRLETSKTPKIVNRKLVFFLTCSIVFGSLSFVSYKPLEASKNDYSVALVNNSKTSLEGFQNYSLYENKAHNNNF